MSSSPFLRLGACARPRIGKRHWWNAGCVGANFRLKMPVRVQETSDTSSGYEREMGATRKVPVGEDSLRCTKLVGSRGKPTIFPIMDDMHADRQFLDSIGLVLCNPASRVMAGHFRSQLWVRRTFARPGRALLRYCVISRLSSNTSRTIIHLICPIASVPVFPLSSLSRAPVLCKWARLCHNPMWIMTLRMQLGTARQLGPL